MAIVPITDPTDPRLSEYALLGNPAALRRRHLFVAEGRLVVRRLLESRRYPVRSVLVNDAARRSLADVLDAAPGHTAVYVAPARIIESVTGYDIHRGCLALAERPAEPPADALLDGRTIVILERVIDADNMGALFRNAAAFRANGVLLSPGCCDPLYRKAVRTSSGAVLAMPFATTAPWPESLDAIRARGFVLVATTPRPDADDIRDALPPLRARPMALLFGTEGDGLSEAAMARADRRVRVPIAAGVDSLNVATAAAIVLHRIDELRRDTTIAR